MPKHKLSLADIPKLTPQIVIGFRTNAGCSGFVMSDSYVGRNDYVNPDQRFSVVAVEGIHRHNAFSANSTTWEGVIRLLESYVDSFGEVYSFSTGSELMKWLASVQNGR